MSFFVNVSPQFLDDNGDPIVGGKLYYGEEGLDPKANPQQVFIDEDLTIPAANPQILDARGVPSQVTIYMQLAPVKYSVQLDDSNDVLVFNYPSVAGVQEPQDLTSVPPVTILDSVTVTGTTDANVYINSGSPASSEGILEYQEVAVPQWRWLRQAIVDGGSFLLRRVAGVSSPDEPVEFPYAGGLIARWLGTDRITVHSTGVALEGEITQNKQVVAAAGTYLDGGAAVGLNHGILGVENTSLGLYTVTLDFFPLAEVDLVVAASAELSGVPLTTHAVGGGPSQGTVLVSTVNASGGATDVTSLTVAIFDMGRI